MPRPRLAVTALASTLVLVSPSLPAAGQQVPLAPVRESDQTVTPAFEGWYRNPDGSYSLSFGYFNRNAKAMLDIPIGPNNFIAPGNPDQGQPTHFLPRRHWGVFAVRVPAEFGNRRVVWTVIVRGQTFSIPGSLNPHWEIDAVAGEAGSGNTPPVLKFDPAGPEGRGPGGVSGAPLTATAGHPLTLVVWASDDGRAWRNISSDGRPGVPVTLTWLLHQGSADVSFTEPSPPPDGPGGKATTTATFSQPGEYVLRVQANDASGVVDGGHAQCCWTNGFLKVTVRR